MTSTLVKSGQVVTYVKLAVNMVAVTAKGVTKMMKAGYARNSWRMRLKNGWTKSTPKSVVAARKAKVSLLVRGDMYARFETNSVGMVRLVRGNTGDGDIGNSGWKTPELLRKAYKTLKNQGWMSVSPNEVLGYCEQRAK